MKIFQFYQIDETLVTSVGEELQLINNSKFFNFFLYWPDLGSDLDELCTLKVLILS